MSKRLSISHEGIRFIEACEGFSAQAYPDHGGTAIGYGSHVAPGSFPDGITRAQAYAMLLADLAPFEEMVRQRVPADCTQQQFDALCSFAYNVKGQPGALEMLLSHGWENVPAQLPRWCHTVVDGVEVEDAGLKDRRLKEAMMFRDKRWAS